MHLAPAMLQDRFVRLEPLGEEHRDALRAALQPDADVWRFIPHRGDGEHFDTFFDRRRRAAQSIPFAVRRNSDARIVGMSCFLAIEPADARVEIGATLYETSARGGPVNPACKLLLLAHAFAAGARRVELKTDARNLRSRAAILKLGAKEEGVLRRHTSMWDGHVRDTVYFSILDHEWPGVCTALEKGLAAFG